MYVIELLSNPSLVYSKCATAIASIMNAKWVAEQGVYYGDFCRVQGAFFVPRCLNRANICRTGSLKMVADLSIAIWLVTLAFLLERLLMILPRSLFAAAHTFFLVFFKLELHKVFAFFSVILGWGLVTAASIGGVLSVDRKKRGPFCASCCLLCDTLGPNSSSDAIAGLWCWVAEGYPGLRISNDYLIVSDLRIVAQLMLCSLSCSCSSPVSCLPSSMCSCGFALAETLLGSTVACASRRSLRLSSGGSRIWRTGTERSQRAVYSCKCLPLPLIIIPVIS